MRWQITVALKHFHIFIDIISIWILFGYCIINYNFFLTLFWYRITIWTGQPLTPYIANFSSLVQFILGFMSYRYIVILRLLLSPPPTFPIKDFFDYCNHIYDASPVSETIGFMLSLTCACQMIWSVPSPLAELKPLCVKRYWSNNKDHL